MNLHGRSIIRERFLRLFFGRCIRLDFQFMWIILAGFQCTEVWRPLLSWWFGCISVCIFFSAGRLWISGLRRGIWRIIFKNSFLTFPDTCHMIIFRYFKSYKNEMRWRCKVAFYFLSENGGHRLKASQVQIGWRISHRSCFFETVVRSLWLLTAVGKDVSDALSISECPYGICIWKFGWYRGLFVPCREISVRDFLMHTDE